MKIDKRVGRKEPAKASEAFAPMIEDRLAAAAVTLAELWSRELAWSYKGEKFYNFAGAPEYLAPPVTESPASLFSEPKLGELKVDPTPKP